MPVLFLEAEGNAGRVRLCGGQVDQGGGKFSTLRKSDVSQAKAADAFLVLFAAYKLWPVKLNAVFEESGPNGSIASKIFNIVDSAERSGKGWPYALFGTWPAGNKSKENNGARRFLALERHRDRYVVRVKPEVLVPDQVTIEWNGKELKSVQQLRDLLRALGVADVKVKASLNVLVWSQARNIFGRSIFEAGVLPLLVKDQVRVAVTLNPPAYMRLLWIGASGKVLPVFPSQAGDLEGQALISDLELPPGNSGWKITAPIGVETMVLLVSAAPMDEKLNLGNALASLPRSPLPTPHLPVDFAWPASPNPAAAPPPASFFTTKAIDLTPQPLPVSDPLTQTHELLKEKLAGVCDLFRAVSFASSAPSA